MKSKILNLFAFLALLLAGNSQAAQSVTFYHHDALGSVIAKSDEDGYLYLNEEYQPYGEKIYATEDFFGGSDDWYTGKNYSEELDLTYFGARWYDARQGRFLSADPAPVSLASIHSFNRYHYANSNPYKYVDPDGNSPAPSDIYFFAKDVGNLLVQEIVYTAAVIKGDDAVANLALQAMVSARSDAAISTVGLVNPVPGTSTALKAAKLSKGGDRLVIGRGKDLAKPGELKPGEFKLEWPSKLPDFKGEWKTNSSLLRQQMRNGKPIRDASPGDKGGLFLNAERNLLENRGWKFDDKSNFWTPPAQ
ncbi:MAG: RHS repeat-associated core domain-containing protein [Gammaproteobacteria bacterium]|jgi:RHS repeat-associated protein